MGRRKIRYVSVKLPRDSKAYPLDRVGNFILPNYSLDYLKKRGRKLFDILMNKVPAAIYSELIRCIREREKF